MGKVLRSLGAVAAGILCAFVLIVAVEIFSSLVHPTPEGFEGDLDELREHVARYPQWVLAVATLAWGMIAFVGTLVAKRIGGRGAGLFVGIVFVAATLFNITSLPYVIWFKVVVVPVIVVGIALALGRPGTTGSQGQSGLPS